MISERDASLKWRELFGSGEVTKETIRKAERLTDELPLESPLRVRLTNELDEICRMKGIREKTAIQ